MFSLPFGLYSFRFSALAFHGAYLRRTELLHTRTEGCSDAFATAANISDAITAPLWRAGVAVLTFFDTVAACAAADSRLVHRLQPAAHAFSPCPRPRPVDSYVHVLKLVLAWPDPIDAVVLLRFDVKYRVSLASLHVDWAKLNFAFPDGASYWAKERKVSDLFHVLPRALVPALIAALEQSPKHRPGAHLVYPQLADALGASRLCFIDPHGRGSNVAVDDPSPRTFLFIDRSCAGVSSACPAATWANKTSGRSTAHRPSKQRRAPPGTATAQKTNLGQSFI